MHLISIDVGVSNLAVCVLKVSAGVSAGGNVTIKLWSLYDVCTANRIKPTKQPKDGTCVARLRNRSGLCGKSGCFRDNGKILCGLHDPAKKHNASDTQNWCNDMLNALPGIGKSIDAVLEDGDTSVLIERQSPKNPKMLLQSHVIYSFFVQHFSNTIPVRLVPAYNKLKCYKGPEIVCTLKGAYAKRKYLARQHTEHFITESVELKNWLPFFQSKKSKQDDLADSFLQGLYYTQKGKVI